VFWVSFNEIFQERMRTDPHWGQISRCFSGKQAIKVLALWFFGLLPFFELKDQHWSMLLITDQKYEAVQRGWDDAGTNFWTRKLLFYFVKTLLLNQ
jgi:hypothetical protein